ncbi:hypothetical protein GCM10020254_05380 [Streptomyces goshikiensis]
MLSVNASTGAVWPPHLARHLHRHERALTRAGEAVAPLTTKDQAANRKKKGSRGGRPVGHDADLYKERNTVERLINKLKAWRGIATRYDKNPGQLPRRPPPPRLNDLDRRPTQDHRMITTSHRP